jgi:hypothetical protein
MVTFANAQNITGNGTVGYLPQFTGGTQLDNSLIFQNAPLVGINTTTPTGVLDIYSACGTGNIGTLVVNTNTTTNSNSACLLSGGSIGDAFIVRNTVGSSVNPTTRTDFIIKSGNGKVGIGKQTPSAQLDLQPTASNVDALLISDFSGNSLFNIKSSGKIGVGTNNPTTLLAINNTNSSVEPFSIINSDKEQVFMVFDNGTVGVNNRDQIAYLDVKSTPIDYLGWLYHGQNANGETRFLVSSDGRASIGGIPAYNESTLTVHSALGSNKPTIIDLLASGSAGWQNQLRFLAQGNNIRHLITDEFGNNKNDLVLAPGLGGEAAAVVRIKGKEEVGIGVDNPNRSAYNSSLFVRGDGVGIDLYNQQATTGWNNQIRFSGSSGIRHIIADDYGTGNLLIKPGEGGGASNVLEVQGKIKVGNVTTPSPNEYSLYVEKGVLAERFKCAIKTTSDWSDFVFDECYDLRSLDEVEDYLTKNKHLPDVPSAEEMVKNGMDVAKMNALLLRKIEELTLYVIDLKKKFNE